MKRISLALEVLVVAFVSFSCAETKDDDDAASQEETGDSTEAFLLESSAVLNGGDLPNDLKCVRDGGDGLSPPLSWSHAPAGTNDFAVLMEHYPNGTTPGQDTPNHYWLLWNIGASTSSLSRGNVEGIGTEGSDKDGVHTGYTPPCSPSGSGTHSYTIRVYALSGEPVSLGNADSVTVGYAAFMAAIEPLALDTAELTFTTTN